MKDLHGFERDQGRLLGRLGQNGIAGNQCGGNLPGKNRQWEIPRTDTQKYSPALQGAVFKGNIRRPDCEKYNCHKLNRSLALPTHNRPAFYPPARHSNVTNSGKLPRKAWRRTAACPLAPWRPAPAMPVAPQSLMQGRESRFPELASLIQPDCSAGLGGTDDPDRVIDYRLAVDNCAGLNTLGVASNGLEQPRGL